MADKQRAHINIKGRVQGVCYRAWTQGRAGSLGLHGWVRNLPDGSVEAMLEGDEQEVAAMIEAAGQGPAMAAVRAVDVNYEPYKGEFRSFEVRY